MNIILYSLVLIFIYLAQINCQTTLGTIDITNNVVLKSVIETKYLFQYDSSLTSPKITFSLLSSSNLFTDIVSVPSSNEVLIGSGQKIQALIQAPTGYQFNSIVFQIYSKGSININGLKSNSIDIQGCIDSGFPITFQNVITNQLTICSKSNVTITGLQFNGASGNVNINSDQFVDLTFTYGYIGTISGSTSSTLTPTINGLCSLNAPVVINNKKVIQGTCGSGGSSTVQVTGLTGVRIISPTGTCPISSVWRDPEPSLISPTSPSISINTPQFSINYPSVPASWAMVSTWRTSTSSFTTASGNNIGGVSVNGALSAKFGGPSEFHLISAKGDKFFRAGQSYQFNFKALLGQAPTASTPFLSIRLCLYNGQEIDPTQTYLEENPVSRVICYPYTSNLTSTTSWTDFTLTFTTPTTPGDIVLGSIGLHIKYTYTLNDQIFFFKDLNIVIPPRSTVTPPSLLTVDSELVTLRKPSTLFTSQNRSTCPHLQSDLLHWHDPSIWPSSVLPLPSSTITLPSNSKVLISSCSISDTSLIYNKIIVPSTSELIFSDSAIKLNVRDIYVQGKLWIGSEQCRIYSKIEIIFNGAKTTSDTIATGLGSKGIAVATGGYISIQGKQYKSTWTRLAATAYPDEYVIYVQDSINWEVGQQVLLTTSRYHGEDINVEKENEILIISAIQGKIIQFTTPLKFYHYGGQEYQTEVALLSRRISIKGAPDSETDKFGGHILTMGNGQFSGIELTKMGQLNMRGRYPIHFHLANHVVNSFVSDCSIYSSYYRCVTTHGTHDLLISENVAFGITGHCYYIEDGVEENNTLSYNLAAQIYTVGNGAAGSGQGGEIFIESETLRQPADASASGFYITNAYNRIIGNSVSTSWASYAFVKLPNSVGAFKDLVFDPSSRTTLEFDGNTAHSLVATFYFGACVYVGGRLYYEPNDSRLYYLSGRDDRETIDSNGNPLWMKFTNTKSFACSDGISHWGNRMEVEKYESHDNHRSATVFGSSSIRFAIVNGKSQNSVQPRNQMKQGFQFYDTWTQTILTDINFRNFIRNPYYDVLTDNPQYQDNRVFVSMTHSSYYKPQGISVVKNITYSGLSTSQIFGHYIQDTDSSRYFNLIDWDGTASLKPGVPTIIGSHLNWWQYDSSCLYNSDWLTWYCDKGSREIGNIDLLVPGLIDQWANDDTILGNSHLFGPSIPNSPRRSSPVSGNAGITGVTKIGWYVYFNSGLGPSSFVIHTRMIPYSQYIILALKYPSGTTFTGKTTYEWATPQQQSTLTSVTTFTLLLNGDGNKYYFDGSHLYVKLVNKMLTGDQNTETFQRGGAKLFNIYTGFRYHVTATCPSNNCYSTDTMPTKWI